jgi:hypothetical protein
MSIEDKERNKYERMWSFPAYRGWSPGYEAAPIAYRTMKCEAGDSLIDMGCGTGRAGDYFHERGLVVTLVDFVTTAVETNHLPFINACLWDLPRDLSATHTFCADVMEHIPPTHVEAVIDCIARATERTAFFQIATGRDSCGELIGEALHLTVEPDAFWRALLVQRFEMIEEASTGHAYRFTGARR